jgi:hypothetical protein
MQLIKTCNAGGNKMNWKTEKKGSEWNKDYSRIKVLLKKGEINKNFLSVVDNVQLEDLVAIKLELAVKAAGGYLYGIPIMKSAYSIVSEGVLKFVMSSTRTRAEAGRLMGGDYSDFLKKLKQFNMIEEVEENT